MQQRTRLAASLLPSPVVQVLVIKFGEHGSTEVKAYGTQRIRKSSKEKNPERFVILVN